MVVELNDNNFSEESKEGNVIIDFWAPWCGPCKMFGPVFEKVSEEKENIKFAKVNVDENLKAAQEYGVMSIPTTVFLKDGEEVGRETGAMDSDAFKSKINEVFGD